MNCLLLDSLSRLEPGQCPRARTKLVRFYPHALEHADIEVAKRRSALGVESQVVPVLESAAGQQHRQVLARVVAGVAEIAAEKNHCVIEQSTAFFFGLLEFREQVAK